MGTFKKYRPAIAMEMSQLQQALNSDTGYNVISYKTLSGLEKNQIWTRLNQTNTTNILGTLPTFCPYSNLIPVCTADENYSLDDYQITAVGTTTYATSIYNVNLGGLENVELGGIKTYSITVANGSENDIVVKCVKFKKTVCNGDYASRDECLVCAFFLEESEFITVPAGESTTFRILMKIGIMGEN